MGMFRKRAVDAAKQPSDFESPIVMIRPNLRNRWRSNLSELSQTLLPSRKGCVTITEEKLQQEPTECGAVSLTIVLSHYGCHIPISTIGHACGVSRDGSDAANLVRAAKLFGLEAKGFKKGLQALKTVTLPAILFWNFDHFLVLDGINDKHYWINDPASGRRCVEVDEFDRCYTGVVLTMRPGANFHQTTTPPTALNLLWRRLQQQRKIFALVLICNASAAVAIAQLPGMLKTFLQNREIPEELSLGIVLLVVGLALYPLGQQLGRKLHRKDLENLQHSLLSLPDWILKQHFSAELSTQQQRIPELIRFLNDQVWPSLPILLFIILWGVWLMSQAPRLGLLLWAIAILWMVGSRWKQQSQKSYAAQKKIAEQRPLKILQGGLQDPETLKASALGRNLFIRWSGLDAQASHARQRLQDRRELHRWIPQLLSCVIVLLLVCIGITLGVAPEILVPLALGVSLMQQRGEALMLHWENNRSAQIKIERIREHPRDPLLDTTKSFKEVKGIPSGAAGVELENVSFGYVPVKPPIIKGVSLSVKPGQRIAIVGGSGSGKSTLAKLIAGLLQPTHGLVELNGQPLMDWKPQLRTESIAMVQQGMPLLSCSIQDNLTLWNKDISIQAIEKVCTDMEILERLNKLPNGFKTVLNEKNQNLSGGEQQRIQIAQALLQRPKLLILDEATSALDANAENKIQKALRKMSCTQITVAHRLSSIRDADEILVLEQGRLVQRGRHASLKSDESGQYNQLLRLEESASNMD